MPESAVGRVAISPSNSPDDSNIREGLGSLNRWSQSTTSSKCSPNYAGHGRQESATRVYTTESHDSIQGYWSPEIGAASNLGLEATHTINGGDQYRKSLPLQRAIVQNHTEPPVLGTPEIDVLPALPTNMTGTNSSQPDPSRLELAPLDSSPIPQTKESPPAEDSFEQFDGQSSHSLGWPTGQHIQEKDVLIDGKTRPSPGKEKPNEKRRQGHTQKVMLSKALQKANTAVLLDNAANFEGAMEAYNDACQLLQLVMLRSNGGEDEKLKLQEIRDTYMIRVTELQRMNFTFRTSDSKALPERPLSQESYGEIFRPIQEDDDRIAGTNPGSLQPDFEDQKTVLEERKSVSQEQIPPRRQSLLPSALDDDFKNPAALSVIGQHPRYELSRQGERENENSGVSLLPEGSAMVDGNAYYHSRLSDLSRLSTQARDIYESTSWLDTIDESGASSPSSTHSNASSVYLRHRRSSRLSHCTEAEFDAALDAAVEAAYDEGLEPASGLEDDENKDDIVANARRNVELAKQKVREAEREAEVAMTRGREIRRIHEQELLTSSNDPESDYIDEEAEEEERLLEEMTRGYVVDDFEFDLQSKSALPRQSDSSSLSGRTWESFTLSNTTTGGTLSPLAEDEPLPSDLGIPPQTNSSNSIQLAPRSISGPGVRARRMSGQGTAELKIETNTRQKPGLDHTGQQIHRPPPPLPKDEPPASLPIHPTKSFGPVAAVHLNKRNMSISSIAEDSLTTSKNPAKALAILDDDEPAGDSKLSSPPRPVSKTLSAPDNLGKPNPSLAPFRARNISAPSSDLPADSPETPSSNAFPVLDIHKGGVTAPVNVLPTPSGGGFTQAGLPSGGLYLFDSHIHSPNSPGSPNPMAANSPLALEPCPESFLLRPFWLLRCIYQTIAHPRGGYLSTKLFIPRDVWRVKNVKIKGIEEKVSNCDLLTAALLKLSKVDTYDADAVLEEMQAFESVLDQVQMSLSKKIGNEVGVQGAMPLFRASQTFDDTSTIDTIPSRSSNGPSKSYLTSWRKLRSKNSGFGAPASLSGSKEASKDNLTISSLPMAPTPTPQPSRRNIAQVQFNGPNANYMSALARLCDAAQVLDQIAQQVEDPGLKHSSQTLVGLELSTRHAAEFFGFYVCRFALNDIGIMLDKFIKRGSEWVLI